jgi:tRNA (guanine-N7-)-methyltransferase
LSPGPVPIDVYTTIRDQRLAALRDEFFPRLPLAEGVPLTLEIGCGHGHYLNAFAAAHPGEFCVGVDLLADRIGRATRKAQRARLPNLLFVQAEAALFLSALAGWPTAPGPIPEAGASPAEERLTPPRLRRVFVLFSDPWPKRRHWKHRVLQPTLLDALALLTAPGAALHFRTDHPEYFAYASDVVAEHPSWSLARPEEPGGAWPFEHVSVFEERALAGVPRSFTALRR